MSGISRDEADARFQSCDAEVRAHAARTECRLDVTVAQLQGELRQTTSELRSEIHRVTATLIKWMAGFSLTIVVMNLGISTFMWNAVMNRPNHPSPTAQAPIIITIPAQAPPTGPNPKAK